MEVHRGALLYALRPAVQVKDTLVGVIFVELVAAEVDPLHEIQVNDFVDRFVAGDGSKICRLLWLYVLMWRDDGMGTTRGHRIIAFEGHYRH